MGGTLCAILFIFFNAFTFKLAHTKSILEAPVRGCENLQKHTVARVGHRTILDVIIPASAALEKEGTIEAAFQAAQEGAESTIHMNTLFGRAT